MLIYLCGGEAEYSLTSFSQLLVSLLCLYIGNQTLGYVVNLLKKERSES